MKSSQTVANPPEATANTAPLFQAFQWTGSHIDGANVSKAQRLLSRLAGDVRDVASGVHLILQMEERDDLDAIDDLRPMLSPNDMSNLKRLAIFATEQLETLAEKALSAACEDWLTETTGSAA